MTATRVTAAPVTAGPVTPGPVKAGHPVTEGSVRAMVETAGLAAPVIAAPVIAAAHAKPPGADTAGGPGTASGQIASTSGGCVSAVPSAGFSPSFAGPAPLSGTSLTNTAATSATTATAAPSRKAEWVPADTACW